MSKTLEDALNEIVIWGGEEDDIEWTLKELEEDASWTIVSVVTQYLETLKRPVAKKLAFGDTTPVENAAYNQLVDELISDINEGKV